MVVDIPWTVVLEGSIDGYLRSGASSELEDAGDDVDVEVDAAPAPPGLEAGAVDGMVVAPASPGALELEVGAVVVVDTAPAPPWLEAGAAAGGAPDSPPHATSNRTKIAITISAFSILTPRRHSFTPVLNP